MNENVKLDFTDYCRTCARKKPKILQNLYQVHGNGKTLAGKIKECISFSFYEFELRPKFICMDCISKLNAAYEFYRLVKNSDEKFKELVASELVGKSEAMEADDEPLIDLKPLILVKSQTKQTKVQPIINKLNRKHEDVHVNEPNMQQFYGESDPNMDKIILDIEKRWKRKLGIQTKPIKRQATVKQRQKPRLRRPFKDELTASEFQCFDCKSMHASMTKLKAHLRDSHNITIECRICGKKFTRHAYIRHLCDGRTEMQCQYCNSKFNSTVLIVKHINCHHKNKQNYKCAQCARAFPTKTLLDIHKPIHDMDENKFLCDICGSRFRTRYQIKEHIETTHTDKRCMYE